MQWPPLVMAISVPNKRQVLCIAWSWNDQYIAAGLVDGNAFVWNASTGTRVSGPFSAGSQSYGVSVSSIAFSYDGLCLALGMSDGGIRIWEWTTEQEAAVNGHETRTLTMHEGAVSSLLFSQDGKQLISGSGDREVRIWDLEKGEVIAGPFCGHNNPVWAVSFLPDQEYIVSRSGFRTVRVWNVKTGQAVIKSFEFSKMRIPTGIIDSAVHYHSNYFFNDRSRVKSGFTPCLWTDSMECEEEEYTPEGISEHWIQAAAFSRNGRFVATSDLHQTHVWYADGESAGKLAGGPFSNDKAISMAFSTDDQRIASGSWDGIVRVWDARIVDEGSSIPTKQGVPYSVAFTLDGQQIVLGRRDGAVEVLDVSTGQEAVKIKEGNSKDRRAIVAISLNGDWIASTRQDEMHIWTRTGKAVAGPLISRTNKVIFSMAFSQCSNDLVACGTEGGTVCLWNASTGTLIAGPQQIYDSDVTALALSSSTTDDGSQTRVSVGCRDKLFVWDTQSGGVIGPFTHHQNPALRSLVFSADAGYITSVGGDYTLCVWDSTDGKVVRGPVGLPDGLTVNLGDFRHWSITSTQDGSRVAFVGKDHTILVFEVLYNGDHEIVLRGPLVLAGHTNVVNRMTFSKDGRFLATTSCDDSVRIWDLQAAAEHKQSLIDSASDDSEITNFDEVFIDNEGWAVCTSRLGGPPLRLMWIPELHRKSLHRPNLCLGLQKEIWLDLERFVHGREWVKCGCLATI